MNNNIEDIIKSIEQSKINNQPRWKLKKGNNVESLEIKVKSKPRPGVIFNYDYDWVISTDGTDHFAIRCPNCSKVGEIYEIYMSPVAGGCLHLKVYCKECHTEGQRKIYLYEDRDKWSKVPIKGEIK